MVSFVLSVSDLIRRGRALRAALMERPDDRSTAAETRIWQHDCEAVMTQLSGGSKAHWLSRAYSEALLVRARDGGALARADLGVIVDRVVEVLERARDAMNDVGRGFSPGDFSRGDEPALKGRPASITPHRFDFVHDRDLRPILEQAFLDGRQALDERRFDEALTAFAGILESILTDALLRRDPAGRDRVVALGFDERIAAAERAGLIRNSCARLPAAARAYRESATAAIVLEGDARTTAQVLRIVMRDLDPGR
jgi:hypothetical protein